MADEFELVLARALSPPDRDPDRQFVAGVQARIALEDKLRSARMAELRELGLQVLALLAIAAGLLWFMRSSVIANLAGQLPGVTLLGLLGGFGLLVALLSAGGESRTAIKLNG